jgi:hypothetical protein
MIEIEMLSFTKILYFEILRLLKRVCGTGIGWQQQTGVQNNIYTALKQVYIWIFCSLSENPFSTQANFRLGNLPAQGL